MLHRQQPPLKLRALPDPERAKPCVLVVDADASVTDLIALHLGTDFRVVGVTDPLEAMPAALREEPGLILCDIDMPGMRGDEVAFALSQDPDTAFIVPLHSDEFRCTPEGKLRVYRTRNGGGSWEPMTRGLPQKDAFETVVRDALGVDALDPAGVYFGTRSGKLFASRDSARSWQLVREGLPPVVCVKTAVVSAKNASARRGRTTRSRTRTRPRARRAA